MTEPRCRVHGPYTPKEAALVVRGVLVPPTTEYLCPACAAWVAERARDVASTIDGDLAARLARED